VNKILPEIDAAQAQVRNNLAKLFGEVFDKGTNMFPVSETDIGK
jgi:hypothetical protein